MSIFVQGLVTAVMLVRDRPEYTRRALESIAACDGDLEFVIVDNGSGPETETLLKEFREHTSRVIEILRFPDDAGGSSRRNAGAAAARGEYLFFVDNDIVADDPALIRALRDVLDADQQLAAASPLLRYPGDTDLVQCAGGSVTADGRIGLVGRGERLQAGHRTDREQVWAPTAALLVRRSSFQRAGGFDESFDPVSLCEDVDLCCRLRAVGERVRYVGTVSARHYEGTTFNHVGHDKRSVWMRHVRVLRNRWPGVFSAGPVHAEADLVWRSVLKDYADPGRPIVRISEAEEEPQARTSFFASDRLLAATRVRARVLVLGCGQAAVRGALPALAPGRHADAPAPAPFFDFGSVADVRVTGIADPDLPNLLSAARWFDVPHTDRDARNLMRTVPAEGVVICTPPAFQAPLVLEALALKQTVLVEKPSVRTHDELDQVLAALGSEPKLAVVVNLPYVHHPALAAMRALVSVGSLGTPRSFSVVFEHSGPAAWAPRAAWYADLRGGVIADLGVHALDYVERIFEAPVERLRPARAVRVGTIVRAVARVGVGACDGTVEIGWDAPRPRFTTTVDFGDAVARADLIPFRAAGSAVEVSSADGVRRIPFDPPPTAGGGPYGEFVAALRDGTPSRTGLAVVAGAIRVMLDWIAAEEGCDR